jgi:hypothetical protein
MEKLSPAEFVSGVFDFWKNPIQNMRILNDESIFIRARGENMERDIRAAIQTDVFNRYSTKQNFINTLMMNVQLGDKGAVMTGSWAMRKARLAKGVALEDVITEYERFGSETQQSSDLSQLSEVQRGGSFEQLFTMFKSNPRQYYAKEMQAVKTLFQEGGTSPENIKKVTKTLIIYHVLLPVVFQWVSNFGGWDEEDRKEYLRAGILGSINGIFILGDAVDAILRVALGLRVWDSEIPILAVKDDIVSAINKLDFEDINSEDVLSALNKLGEASNTLGIPYEQVANIATGITAIMDDDVRRGVGLLLGWSDYALGTPPESKKKEEGIRRTRKRESDGRGIRRVRKR